MGDMRYRSEEERARQQAYQEYLSLRENRSDRGNYIKDDTLYGSYVSNKHLRNNEQEDELAYIDRQHRASKPQAQPKKRKEPVAEPGSRNRADKMTRAEKKEAKKAAKHGGNGGKKKKKNKGLKISLIVVLVLVLLLGAGIATVLAVATSTLNNVTKVELDPALIGIDPAVDEELAGYRNIAVLGIDARNMSDDSGSRSDSIIIASINKETNEIKMFSVYRDTMLNLGDDVGLDKVTHGYFYGGPTKMLYTLNSNLDLNIKEVVVVNWKAVADLVDAVGGVEVEIKDSEIQQMNKYIINTQKHIGGSKQLIEQAGKQNLNGVQAVTYSRIRKDAATGDYRRNERMKIVVKAVFEKCKSMDYKTLKKISKDIMPEIKTNMSSADMLGMMLKLNTFDMTSSTTGWPYNVRGWTGNAWYGPPVTLQSNVSQLHEEFFEQEGYTPTQRVQEISEAISAKTGYY
ncbi:MAG: LCP family protein [Eubacterium sp.]|nr:LCP family protein [Candidatus Colimonas fimequi]